MMPIAATVDGDGLEAPGTLTRQYVDALGRPMTGTVYIRPKGSTGGWVPTTTPVDVGEDGWLRVPRIEPGAYVLSAVLRTADGARAHESATVVVSG